MTLLLVLLLVLVLVLSLALVLLGLATAAGMGMGVTSTVFRPEQRRRVTVPLRPRSAMARAHIDKKGKI